MVLTFFTLANIFSTTTTIATKKHLYAFCTLDLADIYCYYIVYYEERAYSYIKKSLCTLLCIIK